MKGTRRAEPGTGTYHISGTRLRLASPFACTLVRARDALEDVRHGADHATLRVFESHVTETFVGCGGTHDIASGVRAHSAEETLRGLCREVGLLDLTFM